MSFAVPPLPAAPSTSEDPSGFNVSFKPGSTSSGNPLIEQSVTLSAGLNLIHSLVAVPGNLLFAATRTAPTNIIKWANPLTDLATFSVVTFPNDGTESNCDSMIYDSTTGLLYACNRSYLDVSGFTFVKVEQINPTTLAHSVLISTQIDPLNSGVSQGAPVITSDGSFIYLVSAPSNVAGGNSVVYKFNISTGALVSQLDLGANHLNVHTAINGGDGFIYLGGPTASGSINGFVGKVDIPAMVGGTFFDMGQNTRIVDDSCLVGGNYWTGREVTNANGNLNKTTSAMGGNTLVPTGETNDNQGVFTNGGFIYAPMRGSPGSIVKLDPATNAILDTETLNAGQNDANEIQWIGAKTFVTCFLSPAVVIRMVSF